MFNSIQELKDFLVWANTQNIRSLKVDNIEVEFTAKASFELQSKSQSVLVSDPKIAKEIEKLESLEDEELLFFSSKP